MAKNFQELSRGGYFPATDDGVRHKVTMNDLQLGAILRIAEALEKHDVLEELAKDLQVKVDQKKKELDESTRRYVKFLNDEERLRRTIAGLKGHLGHLKKKGAK